MRNEVFGTSAKTISGFNIHCGSEKQLEEDWKRRENGSSSGSWNDVYASKSVFQMQNVYVVDDFS